MRLWNRKKNCKMKHLQNEQGALVRQQKFGKEAIIGTPDLFSSTYVETMEIKKIEKKNVRKM